MSDVIAIASTVPLRDRGKDEYWLQQQIFDNPACLGLGELEALSKERRQSSGGRLDILLKDPEDDSMYEVEVMLGETDETHIIRTIEYWDNEKRKFPLRQHYAVLVAEHINRRYFNVIHLLSHSIPIIAIQTSLYATGGQEFLTFSKILDTYEEIDDGASIETQLYTRSDWQKRANWTVEAADALLSLTKEIVPEVDLVYNKHYIAVNGKKNYAWLYRRSKGKSLAGFRVADSHWEAVTELLDAEGIAPNRRKGWFQLVLDKQFVEAHSTMLRRIVEFAKDA